MIHTETIKYFEDGKMIAEFDNLQTFTDFVHEGAERKVTGEFILRRRKWERSVKLKWLCIGVLCGEVLVILVRITAKYFHL